MRNLIVFLFSLLFFPLYTSGQSASKTKASNWVKKIEVPKNTKSDAKEDSRYLLLDFQSNFVKKEFFKHYAIQIITPEGIQENSDISIDYDPTFQSLNFHKIQIIRAGKTINKWDQGKIEFIQRESRMDRAIYDGKLTALYHLEDVRMGDIIEYSYTASGRNPVYKNHKGSYIRLGYSVSIGRKYRSILLPPNENIFFKSINGAELPIKTPSPEGILYEWDIKNTPPTITDNNIPNWFTPYPYIQYSTNKDWSSVTNWAINLFDIPNKFSENPLSLSLKLQKEERIDSIVTWIQDEVRYLGIESGVSSHKPHPPKQIFEQRFGDCKDKSLLLVQLLEKESVKAYPLLVNTYERENVNSDLPNIFAFNHCVVAVFHENDTVYIDPTLRGQGGGLNSNYFPDYAYGLLVKKGEQKLIRLPAPTPDSTFVEERIKILSINGDADLRVKTKFTGSNADDYRSYYNNNSTETLKKSFENFYSSIYPTVQAVDLTFKEGANPRENEFFTTESFSIENAWTTSEDSSFVQFITTPLVLTNAISPPATSQRTMPYYLGNPFYLEQKIIIDLPENWSTETTEFTLNGPGFKFAQKIYLENKTRIIQEFQFELTKTHLAPDSAQVFIDKINELQNNVGYYISYNYFQPKGSELSWIAFIILFITAGAGVYFSRKIYTNFNPRKEKYTSELEIGGWLVLPMIGLFFTLLFSALSVYQDSSFYFHNWWSVFTGESTISLSFMYVVLAEFIYNTWFLIFTVLILVLFFKKRSCLPPLICILYFVSFLFPILDLEAIRFISEDLVTSESETEIYTQSGKALVGAIIWIPYFMVSTRVKRTFGNFYPGSKEENPLIE